MQGRLLLAAVASAAALGFLAAPAAADAAADGLAKAKESLAKYTAMPQFVAPGEPFDAKKCAAGKKMMSIPNNSANPFLKGIIDREKAAGAKVGLEVTEWENQGQPSQWIQGVELAIRDKYDIIDLISGIDPGTIAPQLEAAKAAGVKVMTSHFYDPSFAQHPVVSSSLTIGFGEIGKILADWADRGDRRQGQYRADRLQRGAADDPAGGQLQEGARRQLPAMPDQAGDQCRCHRMGHQDPAGRAELPCRPIRRSTW